MKEQCYTNRIKKAQAEFSYLNLNNFPDADMAEKFLNIEKQFLNFNTMSPQSYNSITDDILVLFEKSIEKTLECQ